MLKKTMPDGTQWVLARCWKCKTPFKYPAGQKDVACHHCQSLNNRSQPGPPLDQIKDQA